MINQNKKSFIYFVPAHKFICVHNFKIFENFISALAAGTKTIYEKLTRNKLFASGEQLHFFNNELI